MPAKSQMSTSSEWKSASGLKRLNNSHDGVDTSSSIAELPCESFPAFVPRITIDQSGIKRLNDAKSTYIYPNELPVGEFRQPNSSQNYMISSPPCDLAGRAHMINNRRTWVLRSRKRSARSSNRSSQTRSQVA